MEGEEGDVESEEEEEEGRTDNAGGEGTNRIDQVISAMGPLGEVLDEL